MQYLQQIEGVLCIKNEKNELLWYVRGKSVHGDNRGQIYRPNHQPKTNFDLSTNSHGNRSNTCIQNNNKNNGNHNKNNHNGNNKAKVDCNNNAPNGIGGGGHYDYQRNGTPLVRYFILHFVFFFSFLQLHRIVSSVRPLNSQLWFIFCYSQAQILRKQSKTREWL